MKLNNNGWGYRDMVIYTCIILFALIFVAISISSFYDGLVEDINSNRNNTSINNEAIEGDSSNSNVVDSEYYLLKENELKSATIDYLNKYSYDLDQDIMTVTMETLVSLGFIETIYDQTDSNVCTGYSNVYIYEDDYGVVPYISCSNYVTLGY